MNEIKMNDDNSGDTYELYRNLFSNQIFKPTKESYNGESFLDEKQIKFQSDENGFLFFDGKTELEKNYLSDNEFSFGEAVDFIKQLEHDSCKINLKVKVDQAWNDIKSFFGFVNENQDNEQKKLEAVFGDIANDLKRNNMSQMFDDLRSEAKKLNDALTREIKSTNRKDPIKILLETKKYYFKFELSVKGTLNAAKKIISQNKYLSTERLNIIEKKYGSGTENYTIMKNALEMVKDVTSKIICSEYKKAGICYTDSWFGEFLDLLASYDMKKLVGRKELINDIKQIVQLVATNLYYYSNFDSKLKKRNLLPDWVGNEKSLLDQKIEIKLSRKNLMDGIKNESEKINKIHSLLSDKNLNEEKIKDITDNLEELTGEMKKLDDIRILLSEKQLDINKTEEIKNDLQKLLDELEKTNKVRAFLSKKMEYIWDFPKKAKKELTVNDWIRAFDILYEMLSDLESMLDNENVFYEMIDNSISDLETSLNEYDINLIQKAKQYEEQLQKIPKDKVDSYKKTYNKLNASDENLLDLNLGNLRLENDEKYKTIAKDDLTLLKDIDEICQVYSCFQIYNYFNEKELEQENNNLSSFKTNHNYYFWFYLHKELFLIGYLFRLIAWIMLTCSGNLESDYSNYQVSFDKEKILQQKKKILDQNEIISEDELKNLCNKIFGDANEKDNEINTSNKEFVINKNENYSDLKNELSEKMKNELSKLEKLIDIHGKRSKLKQLKIPDKIISALKSQARILEANRPMISISTLKLLDIPAEKIEGKSVDELLRTKDISPEQNKQPSEPPTIKTLYFSKDKLFTISEEQKENNMCKSGSFSTVFEYKGKILKPGKMRMICKKDDKFCLTEAGRLNCFKENSSVLVDTAVKGNIAYEVAKLFDLNCIVSTSIAISDDNHISVMENAIKDGRVRYCDKKYHYVAQAIGQINDELQKYPDNVYKLFCAASELNFLDVLLFQSDRHFGNFSYNANGICGIDNDFIMPTKSSLIIKEINKHMGLFNNKLSSRPRKYRQNSIEQLAMMKIPIIPKELYKKIMSVSSEDLQIVLNLFFIDDYQGREKVDFAIERFEEIKQLINDGIIKVIDKFDDNVMSEILEQNALVECETFIATGRILIRRSNLLDNMYGNLILRIMEACKSSPKKKFEKYIYDVDLRRHYKLKENIKKNKKFCSDWLDGLIARENSNPQSKQQKYYEELKRQISEIEEDRSRY